MAPPRKKSKIARISGDFDNFIRNMHQHSKECGRTVEYTTITEELAAFLRAERIDGILYRRMKQKGGRLL